jgi:hypothetical protein
VPVTIGTGIVDGRAAVPSFDLEVGMPQQPAYHSAIPLIPILLGLVLSVWRFRIEDRVGGLVFGLAGVVLMIAVASWRFRTVERN